MLSDHLWKLHSLTSLCYGIMDYDCHQPFGQPNQFRYQNESLAGEKVQPAQFVLSKTERRLLSLPLFLISRFASVFIIYARLLSLRIELKQLFSFATEYTPLLADALWSVSRNAEERSVPPSLLPTLLLPPWATPPGRPSGPPSGTER